MVEEAPRGRDGTWRSLALFFAANVLFGAGLYAHAFLYNFYLQELGFAAGVMGLAAGSLTAGGLAALIPAGMVIDRIGARAAFYLAVALASTGLVLGAFVTEPAAIYGAAFVAGSGTAVWRVTMGPMVLRLAESETRARAFSWNVALLVGSGALWTVAAGAAPGWIEGTLGTSRLSGIRWALLAGAIATALGAAVLFLSRGGAAHEQEVKAVAMRAATIPGGVRIPLPLLVAVLVVAVWMTAGGMVIPFFNLYFQREHGLSIARIGALFAIAQAITAAVVFASGELASRIGPHRLLFAWTLVLAPVVWLLVPAETLTVAIALYLVQGFVPPATNPLIDQLLLERAPRGREGVVSSWRNAATELSGFAGASGGGFLLERGSFGALFATAGALAATGAAGLALVIRRLRRNGDAFGMRDQVPSAEAADAMRSDTLPRTSS